MNFFTTLRLNRLKWRHWVLMALLLLITLTKLIPRWSIAYTFCLYPRLARLLSHISGWIPFAIGDLFIALSIAWVIIYPIYKRKKTALIQVAEYLLWVYAWFYIAWGLNYSQPNIFIRMHMMPAEVKKETLRNFAYRYVDTLNALREERRAKREETTFGGKKGSPMDSLKEESFEKLKEETRCEVLKGYNKLTQGERFMGINKPFNQHPHAKTMMFSSLSSMAGVTGSMGPFFCEYTLNGDVLPHDYPATYAHEFAHFLGVANEGEANFYSYLICTTSTNREIRFSGYYHIFFHVLANVYDILGEKEGNALLRRVNPRIIQMARNDRRYWLSKRSKAIDAAQDLLFDLYLKGNNIKEGRKSYSGVILLILSWENI